MPTAKMDAYVVGGVLHELIDGKKRKSKARSYTQFLQAVAGGRGAGVTSPQLLFNQASLQDIDLQDIDRLWNPNDTHHLKKILSLIQSSASPSVPASVTTLIRHLSNPSPLLLHHPDFRLQPNGEPESNLMQLYSIVCKGVQDPGILRAGATRQRCRVACGCAPPRTLDAEQDVRDRAFVKALIHSDYTDIIVSALLQPSLKSRLSVFEALALWPKPGSLSA